MFVVLTKTSPLCRGEIEEAEFDSEVNLHDVEVRAGPCRAVCAKSSSKGCGR